MITLPETKKYHLVYRNSRGECKSYNISNPIEQTTDDFTAYSYKHGIRKFKKSRVIKIVEQ